MAISSKTNAVNPKAYIVASSLLVSAKRGSKPHSNLSQDSKRLFEILQDLVFPSGKPPVITAKEIMLLWGYKGDRMVYDILAEKKTLKGIHLALLARECSSRGDNRLVEFMLPPGVHVKRDGDCEIDGQILEEINMIVEHLGECSKAFKGRDLSHYHRQLDDLKRSVAALEEEGRALLQ
jgi:hypothetical protein